MHSFEFILIFSALVTILALVVPLLENHRVTLDNVQQKAFQEWSSLHCSSRADFSSSHFLLLPAHDCLDYSFALNPVYSPFLLVLGVDSNHYG